MKPVKAFTSGLGRSLRSYKPVLITWLISLLGVSIITVPFKSMFASATGNSLATNLISQGFTVDFWTSFDGLFLPSMTGALAGLLILLAIFFFINIFLNAGIFHSVNSNVCGYSAASFFSAAATNFFAFLGITLVVLLILLTTAALVIGLPVLIVRSGSGGELAMATTMKIVRIVFLVLLPIILLVADYARAWTIASNTKKVFKAVGYGFKATFTSFVSSYLFMAVIIGIQVAFLYGFTEAMDYNPKGPGGLFLLFLMSQALLIVKVFLRAWRYGGVTALYTL